MLCWDIEEGKRKVGSCFKMNKKILFVFLILFLLGIGIQNITAQQVIEKTQSSETFCLNGVCSLTLYSGIVNVYEDNQWKKIEDARSLKNSGYTLNIQYGKDKEDPKSLEIIDFNYTSIILNNIDVSELAKTETSLSIKFYNSAGEILSKSTTIPIKTEDMSKDLIINWNFGDIIHLGNNSTTITLNESNGGNIGDTYIQQANGNTNYGTANPLTMNGAIAYSRAFLSWNLSSIPSGSILNYAYLNLTKSGVDTGTVILYYVNQTFGYAINETGLTYNNNLYCNGDSGAVANCSGIIDTLPNSASFYLNATAGVNWSMDRGFTNITFMIKSGTSQYVTSKESATVSARPQLIINYDTIDTSSPLWSNNSTNGTTAGTWINHSVVWTDDTALSNYTFSFDNGTGTFVNDSSVSMTGISNQSSVVKYVNQTGNSTIRWMVWSWDTTGNKNHTAIFSYTTPPPPPPVTISSTCTGLSTSFVNSTSNLFLIFPIMMALFILGMLGVAIYILKFSDGNLDTPKMIAIGIGFVFLLGTTAIVSLIVLVMGNVCS